MSDRIFISKYLETYFDEVEPFDFYRSIFPEGELENHEERQEGKYNALAVELLPETADGNNSRRYVITDELDILPTLLEKDNFIIISPISYIGKSRQSKNARFIYAIAIDLDGITEEHYLVDLFHQIEIEHLPKPTYIIWSGTGLHFYYQLENPVPCFNNIIKQLAALKKALTKLLWNNYTTALYEKPQIESLFQGFRMVGGITKNGNRTRAFEIGDKVSLEYLNSFVSKENRITEFKYKSKLTLKAAAQQYPEWYQNRILEKKPKGTWQAKKAVYDWWIDKIHNGAAEGHRYFVIMVLSIYAKKCGVDRKTLEEDAFNLVEELDNLTITQENHFTRDDVLAALEMYNDSYITFPIDTITTLTAIPIEKNKRNFRKQEVHLARARAVQNIDYPNGEWRYHGGRPKGSKQKNSVIEWHNKNKDGTIEECMKETGVSKSTVYKYWKEK